MCTLTSMIESLSSLQQQAIIDILATIQEQKHLSKKQVGLIGCSVKLFPVEEVKNLFSKNLELKNTVNRLLAEQGYTEHGFINLNTLINAIIETEVERRITEQNQKDLFDLAEEIEE